jgi:LL-diaminopimelate aminotransferase
MIINTADRLQKIKEYYFSVKLQEVKKLNDQGKDVINMGIGSPDLPPSKETIDALCEVSAKPNVHGYQPYRGISPLRNAMAAWYQRTYGVDLEPETEIIPLMGSKEGITHISLTFLNEGDEVLIPELGYPTYTSVTEMVGAVPKFYPLLEGAWEPDFEKIEKLVSPKTKIMWVNYPHMPTGANGNEMLFEKIIGFALKHKLLVCHDNPYSLILNNRPPLSLLSVPRSKECCIELSSMSKSHNMAGWRVGWISGGKDYLDEIIKIKSNFDSGMFYGIQFAATKAFLNNEEWHAAQNRIYAERKEVVYDFLDILNCTYDKHQVGMFVWAKLPDTIKSAEGFVDHLLYNYLVFITPGFIFGSKGERYIRISLCSPRETILKALQRIKNIDIDLIKV